MIDCCRHNKTHKECKRSSDGKVFKLPRKFLKKQCENPKGFTMRSSCAPYIGCNKVFNVYTNQNPKNTISIKYTTIQDVKDTISKLKIYHKNKTYSHKRIKQVAMILMVRLRVLKDKKKTHYELAKAYHNSLQKKST
jgi:hypothetical protein